jgi:hypothetical protein
MRIVLHGWRVEADEQAPRRQAEIMDRESVGSGVRIFFGRAGSQALGLFPLIGLKLLQYVGVALAGESASTPSAMGGGKAFEGRCNE